MVVVVPKNEASKSSNCFKISLEDFFTVSFTPSISIVLRSVNFRFSSAFNAVSRTDESRQDKALEMQPSAFFAHFHPDCASMSSESYANATLSSSALTINAASNPFLSTCSNSCVSSASSGTSFTPATPHNESTRFCSSDPSNGINVGGGDCSTALVGPVPLSVHSAFCCFCYYYFFFF